MRLGDLLKAKESRYRFAVTVTPDETVAAAIQKLGEHDRGALPVCNHKGELVGIITERDIVRKLFSHPEGYVKTRIEDVMSKQVVIGSSQDDLSYAVNVMKQKRIRHLPIVDNQRLIGMISMRDLLGVQLEECETKVRYLNDYISRG